MAEAEQHYPSLTEKLAADADAAHQRIVGERTEAIAGISGMVEDIARQAVERLVDTSPEPESVRSAVNAAFEGRA